jgi:hypothetical protein
MSRPPRESDDVVLYYSIPSSISSYHPFKSAKTNTEGGGTEGVPQCRIYTGNESFFFKILKKSLVDAWRVSDMFARGVAVA